MEGDEEKDLVDTTGDGHLGSKEVVPGISVGRSEAQCSGGRAAKVPAKDRAVENVSVLPSRKFRLNCAGKCRIDAMV